MSSNHDHDHPVTESKPVSFTVPLILALVTMLLILLSVSTCDRKKDCCCCEGENATCETNCEDKHGEHHGAETKEGHHEEAAAAVSTETVMATDSAAVSHDTTHVHTEAPAHTEAHH